MTAERLISVAQRLDELAEEHDIPELATLSEEMGLVAERWPREQAPGDPLDPAVLREHLHRAFQILEREILGTGMHDIHRRERERELRAYARMQYAATPNPDLSRIVATINGT